jgi:outer membrane receptor protein involved in Fe transport
MIRLRQSWQRRLLWAAAWLAASGGARAADAVRNFHIAAGEATTTLQAYSEQSGEQIVYPVDRVRGIRTQAVQGALTARAALERMLAGTELRMVQDERTGALAISRGLPPPPAAIRPLVPPVAPSAPAAPSDADETVMLNVFEVRSVRDGSYAALDSNSVTAFRTDLELLPVTAEVFTKAFMDDIGATTVEEMLVNYSGIAGITGTLIDVAPGDRDGAGGLSLRGFSAPGLKRDGFIGLRASLRTATGGTDNFAIERAELIAGPQSLLYGGSGGGGVVNLISKRATFQRTRTEARLSVNTYGGRRLTLDQNAGDGHRAIRVALAGEQTRNLRSNLGGRFGGAYLQFAYRFAGGTTVRLWGQRDASDANHSFQPNLTPFFAATDPRVNQGARWLALTGRLADVTNVTAGGLTYGNTESFASWWASELIRNQFAGLTVETGLAPWLAGQFAVIYGETADSRIDPPNRALLPARGLPGAGANPLDETAFQVQPADNDQPHRVKGARATLVAQAGLFQGRVVAQTAFGLEAVHNTDQDNIDYAYYLADATGAVPFDPTLPDYGRTRLGPQYFPVGHGVPRAPLFRPRTVRVTVNGLTYVRLPRIYADPARATPRNPQGLIPNNPTATNPNGFAGNHSHADTHSAAVFLSNFTTWFDQRATTLAGVRFSRSTALNSGPNATAYRPPWDHSLSGNLSFSYRLRGGLRAYATASTSYTAIEGTSRDLVGTQLRPVKAKSPAPELGFKFHTADRRFTAELSYSFVTSQQHETALVDASYQNAVNPNGLNGTSGAPDRRVNVDRTSRGAELRLEATPTPTWRARFAFAAIDGRVERDVAYPQLYNDQFFANAAGTVTYRDGAPLLVDPAGPAGPNRNTPLTLAMINDPANPYWANPDPDSGAITGGNLRAALSTVDPLHGPVATGVTGLPLARIQYAFSDPNQHHGVITVFRAGEKSTGYNEFTVNFQNSFTFDHGPLRGFGGFIDARTYLKNRAYYVQYSAPGGRPLNGVRALYRLPPATVFNFNLHYRRKIGTRYEWTTQLNVTNALNHYRAWIVPDPASGAFSRARLSVQPRAATWSNTLSF